MARKLLDTPDYRIPTLLPTKIEASKAAMTASVVLAERAERASEVCSATAEAYGRSCTAVSMRAITRWSISTDTATQKLALSKVEWTVRSLVVQQSGVTTSTLR
jgi:hypothetical protein